MGSGASPATPATGGAPSAQPGAVLVVRTVQALVAGSGLRCADRGSHGLKRSPDEGRLFAIAS